MSTSLPDSPSNARHGRTAEKDGASPILQVTQARYQYDDSVVALGSVDIQVSEGEIVAIIGPSGCGKSTLLGLIAGLLEPSAGTVEWNSTAAELDSPRSRRLFTLVFQKDTLLPWLTVERNIAFGLRYLVLTAEEKQQRIDRLLEIVKLNEFRDAYPYQLSGGMRRRVAFLTGVAPLPKVLLLDEPFSALDEPTRVAIHGEVVAIVKQLGITVLIVTHDLSEAISLANRVYILTNRPASVASEWDIPFPYPRNMLELRETAEYQQTYRKVWHELSQQLQSQAT